MAVKKSGLGKGLDSLIPEKAGSGEGLSAGESGQMVRISRIEPNRDQPRKHFREEELAELADSIKRHGVIQPLLVKKKGDFYEIVAGERRWRAAKLAGVAEVPVIVKDYTDSEILEISLIENIQREDLNPIEEALAYKRLTDEFHMKQDEIAERVSKSRTAVSNTMRLLKLDARIRDMLIDGSVTAGHARALLDIGDADEQYNLALRICSEHLSVRETEDLVRHMKNPAHKTGKKSPDDGKSLIYRELAERMTGAVGTKVSVIRKPDGKGKIEIEYYSDTEFERIYDLLMSGGPR